MMQGDVVLTSQRRENTASREPFESKYESLQNIHADVLDSSQDKEKKIQGLVECIVEASWSRMLLFLKKAIDSSWLAIMDDYS
jgi:hypothetical protein